MNRPLAFGLTLIAVAVLWPLLIAIGVIMRGWWLLVRGWRIVSVKLVSEDELRKEAL